MSFSHGIKLNAQSLMIKTFILPLILLFISFEIFSQTLEEREKLIAVQNHIKTKTQIDFSYQDGNRSKTGVITSITQFSRTGEIEYIHFVNSKGQVTNSEVYEYDQNNNRTLYHRNGTGSKYKKSSEYDSKNNLIVEAGFNGSENFRNEFSYNNSGQLLTATYSINGSLRQKMIYRTSGNTTTVETYMGGSALMSKIKIVYDSKGNIIEETTYSVEGKELEKKIYKYNSSSQILEETKTREGDFYYSITYTYDSQGNLLSMYEETLAKKKYAKKVYSYDENGNLAEYKWRRYPNEEFNVKKYTYNSKGICLSEHTLYPKTNYELFSKFEYDFY